MENNVIVHLKENTAVIQSIIALSRKGADTAILAQQEIAYIEAAAMTKPVIKECEPISVLLAVKNVLRQNLTMDPYAGLVYIKTRNINAGTSAAPQWKKVLEIQPSVNGLISIARQCGRILDIKRPQVTKDVTTGQVIGCSVEILLPSTPAPRWEKFEFDADDIWRWRRASHNENGRNKQDADANTFNYANPNYTNFKGGVDPEFARAKAVRHALKKLGTNQNEVPAGTLIIDLEKREPLINPEKDASISNEENGYTQFTEIKDDLPNI